MNETVKNAAIFFSPFNRQIDQNPKLNWIIGDAYRKILGTKEKYSVIVSEPSNPWVTGVERLYSTEFYEAAKAKLEDNGFFVQWFHSYDIAPSTMAMVFNTFSSSFPYVRVFADSSDVMILGSKNEFDNNLDWSSATASVRP